MRKPAGQEFLKKTRLDGGVPTPQQMGLAQPRLETEVDRELPIFNLPQPDTFPAMPVDFLAFVELRTSVREYASKALTQEELSFLLWCTQGVKQVVPRAATFRTVPSAGARHALETYLLINRVEGLEPGLYRFLALDHQLQQLSTEAAWPAVLSHACKGQEIVKNSAVSFFWVAESPRMTWRYGERGYRYLFLDAGHVCQNLYLSSEAVGCGCCAIGAFDDEALHDLLDLGEEERFVVYGAAVGKKYKVE
ncbi:SagB/ThcOx family dehydrogenase [Anaeromusa acidaminophila]|uniref:SagB/ThcOx family dehydrogenase n=1 Tax=Anaeromusa acidaminophila TaxID=81464 RepID=UPI000364F935|nr:SagB/ThcOx family dehydrogenase [Anaeromusa acidaminophila]